METYTYKVLLTHEGTDPVEGNVEAKGLYESLTVSPPPEFGGKHGLWSPEQLLVAAVSSCFWATLRAVAQFSRVPLPGYEAEAEARMERVPGEGYRFTELLLRPIITVEKEDDILRLSRVLEKAERNCPVARGLNFPLRVEARIELAQPVPATEGR